MITRFSGTNVGCFDTISVDLEPLTVFVGPNASGKSTILRAIRTLALLARAPLYARRTKLLRLAGVATLADFLRDPAKETTLAVEVRSGDGTGQYSITLGVDSGTGSVEVRGEKAQWTPRQGKEFRYDSAKDHLEFEYRGTKLGTDVPRSASLPYFAFPHWKSEPKWNAKLRGLYSLVSCFAPFHVYRFSPGAIAQPADPNDSVAYDGNGLAAELDRLLGSNRQAFDGIVQELKAQFGHIQNLNIPTIQSVGGQAQKLLEFEAVGGRRFPAAFESDGVLLTLAYLWLSHRQSDPAVGIEDPETAAHPPKIDGRVKLLRKLSDGSATRAPIQVLATTQSPGLLMALGNTEELRVCGADRTVTKTEERRMSDLLNTSLNWTLG